MAKLALLLATFTVLSLVANASVYLKNPRQQRCEEQIQWEQRHIHCQQFLKQAVKQSGSSWGLSQQLQPCCQQLAELDNECRCKGIKKAVPQQQQQGELEDEEIQLMYEIASYLPTILRSSWWF